MASHYCTLLTSTRRCHSPVPAILCITPFSQPAHRALVAPSTFLLDSQCSDAVSVPHRAGFDDFEAFRTDPDLAAVQGNDLEAMIAK